MLFFVFSLLTFFLLCWCLTCKNLGEYGILYEIFCGSKHYVVKQSIFFRPIGFAHFSSKGGKVAAYEERYRWNGAYFQLELAFYFWYFEMRILLPIFTLIWGLNDHVSRQGRDINKTIKSTKIIILSSDANNW